jgi:hypothetical protein
MDVLVAISSSGDVRHIKSTSVLTFLGDGTGSLEQGVTAKVGQEPHTVVATDFSGDGHVDLVVSNRTDATISILLGDGHGSFTTHATLNVNAVVQGAVVTK